MENSWAAVLIPVLQGVAGGTLLYVTVSEVLPRERARWHRNIRRSAGLVQFFSVLLGFSLVYCLNKYLRERLKVNNYLSLESHTIDNILFFCRSP